jgi:hypothetical protein
MSNRRRPLTSSDPRSLGGDIAGPGGPLDANSVVFNTERSVLVDHATAAIMHGEKAGDFVGLMIEGRVNRSPDRVKVVLLLNGDGVAATSTELGNVMKRARSQGLAADLVAEYVEAMDIRLEALKAAGL